jgi:aerobic carbon-monoxide dehydrogenase medium subunit
VIASQFDYLGPRNRADAVSLLSRDPEGTTILGGGTWVVPDMDRGLIHPRRVLDLGRSGLAEITLDGSAVQIGAMATYASILDSPVVREHAQLLHTMAAGITGGRQVTQQATLGGSAMAARPQSDAPATLVTLNADAILVGPRGERRVRSADLFTGAMQTATFPDELLAGFEFASTAGLNHGYFKLKRGGSSWPIATAAVSANVDASGACISISLSLGGVSATPVGVDLGTSLVGQLPTLELIDIAASLAARSVTEPWGDVLAPASYRAAVTRPVARRALTAALLPS